MEFKQLYYFLLAFCLLNATIMVNSGGTIELTFLVLVSNLIVSTLLIFALGFWWEND